MSSDDKQTINALAVLNTYLAEKKLRRTPERFAILRKVLEMTRHFHIETLYEAMDADGYHVSRATVYNTMSLLVDAGIVRRHRFASNEAAQYEKIADATAGNHIHLLCLKCGKVKEIKDSATLRSLTDMRYQSFTPDYFTFYVYGTCSGCMRRSRKKNLNKVKS